MLKFQAATGCVALELCKATKPFMWMCRGTLRLNCAGLATASSLLHVRECLHAQFRDRHLPTKCRNQLKDFLI